MKFNAAELDTPCLVLDLDILDSNLAKMRDFAAAHGKQLRPHAKTHKCSELAKRQLAAGNCAGICAAKVSEAEALIAGGVDKVLLTSPTAHPLKLRRLMKLAARTPGLMQTTDSFENAEALNAEAGAAGVILRVLVDIDPCMGRTGTTFELAPALVKKVISLPNLRFEGIQCYCGNLQHVHDFSERAEKSAVMMRKAAAIVRQLRAEGIPCPVLTGTGTGTSAGDAVSIPELTDMQVGSYCVMDAEYSAIGSRTDPNGFHDYRPALSLYSSVVSANRNDFVTIDAGLKAMYFTPDAPPRVLDERGGFAPGWRYDWFGDEHGMLYFPGAKPRLGDVFRLCVSHCDPTINLFDRMFLVKGGAPAGEWKIDLRGMTR